MRGFNGLTWEIDRTMSNYYTGRDQRQSIGTIGALEEVLQEYTWEQFNEGRPMNTRMVTTRDGHILSTWYKIETTIGRCREGIERNEKEQCRGRIENCKECKEESPTCQKHKTAKGTCSKECEKRMDERMEEEKKEEEEFYEKESKIEELRTYEKVNCLRGVIKNEKHLCQGYFQECKECEKIHRCARHTR